MRIGLLNSTSNYYAKGDSSSIRLKIIPFLTRTGNFQSNSVRDQCVQLLLGLSFFRVHRIPLRGNCNLTELQLSGFLIFV